jgi:hypothetical protein
MNNPEELKLELEKANNNIITIMENRVILFTGCDRETANLVVNQILDLNCKAMLF